MNQVDAQRLFQEAVDILHKREYGPTIKSAKLTWVCLKTIHQNVYDESPDEYECFPCVEIEFK